MGKAYLAEMLVVLQNPFTFFLSNPTPNFSWAQLPLQIRYGYVIKFWSKVYKQNVVFSFREMLLREKIMSFFLLHLARIQTGG